MTQFDENYLVVQEDVEHPIFPANADQLKRTVILKGDFEVKGGIYCNDLRADGRVQVHGPVLARQEITLHPPEEGMGKPMMFRQGICAVRAVSVKVNDLNQYTPVNTRGYTPLVIKGDVCAPEVRLENTVLVGNVRADRALLKDCIVFGSPIIQDDLQLENTIVLSYQAGSVQFRGRNTLLVPYGISRSPITEENFELISQGRGGADAEDIDDEWPEELLERGDVESGPHEAEQSSDPGRAWVRYMGLCSLPQHGCGERIVPCEAHYKGACRHADVRMRPDDVLVTRDAEGNQVWMLTLAHRIINLTRVEDELVRLKSFIKSVLTLDQMDGATREMVLEAAGVELYPDEAGILNGLQQPAISAPSTRIPT